MAKNNRRNSNNISDKKLDQVRNLLLGGKLSKREIANIVGIKSGYVYRMAAEMKLGQQKNQVEGDAATTEVVEEPQLSIQEEVVIEQDNNNPDEIPANDKDLSTDDLKLQIVEDLVGGMRMAQVCKKHHVTPKTVSAAIHELGYVFSKTKKAYLPADAIDEDVAVKKKTDTKSSKQPKKEVEKKQPKSWKDKVVDIDPVKHLVCTTFNARHPIPVELAVYGKSEMTPAEMFDFDWQMQTATKFILDNVEFKNNVPDRDIICYPTGNIQALASLIKACEALKVNLTFMHYNSEDKSRDNAQVIFDKFPDGNKRGGTPKQVYKIHQ